MEAYFVRDKDPYGGNYSICRGTLDMEQERLTIQEVRKGDFPAELWMQINFGELEIDRVTHYDTYILPYWHDAEVWWTREGGYVNGTE